MKKVVKFILFALIFGAITVAGYWVGKFLNVVFEGSTIRIWFIPLGNGTAGTIMWVFATLVGFGIAYSVVSSFIKNRRKKLWVFGQILHFGKVPPRWIIW